MRLMMRNVIVNDTISQNDNSSVAIFFTNTLHSFYLQPSWIHVVNRVTNTNIIVIITSVFLCAIKIMSFNFLN